MTTKVVITVANAPRLKCRPEKKALQKASPYSYWRWRCPTEAPLRALYLSEKIILKKELQNFINKKIPIRRILINLNQREYLEKYMSYLQAYKYLIL
jgi:hypothetical protein